jgi:hypothetical protein
MRETAELTFRNFPLVIVSDFVLRASSLPGDDLGAKLESPAPILFLPKQVVGIGQHLGDLQLSGFR